MLKCSACYIEVQLVKIMVVVVFLWLSVSSAKVVGSSPREHMY